MQRKTNARQVASGPILDFALEHAEWERGRIESHYSIREVHTGEEMTDALQFIFIDLGRFSKRIDELENDKEKLYFCLLNMGRFLERPKEMQAEMFRRLFDVSEVEGLPSKEREQYIKDMAIERDIINQKEYARQEGKLEGIAEGEARGRQEGLAEGRARGRKDAELQIVRAMLARGMDAGTVAEITGLEESFVRSL